MTLLSFTQHIPNIVGYAASICMVLGYLHRRRDQDVYAVGTFLLMAIGGFFFMIQGLLLENWPLFLCNLCTTTMSAIIFAIKMTNDWKKKKQQQP